MEGNFSLFLSFLTSFTCRNYTATSHAWYKVPNMKLHDEDGKRILFWFIMFVVTENKKFQALYYDSIGKLLFPMLTITCSVNKNYPTLQTPFLVSRFNYDRFHSISCNQTYQILYFQDVFYHSLLGRVKSFIFR